MNTFHNKVVIVTGGGQGIGRAVCRSFAEKGAKVVIADLDKEAGLENENWINQKLSTEGVKIAQYIETDVACELNIKEMISQVKERFGQIDILVNNAGIGHTEPIFTLDAADFDRVLSVNLRGTFLCSKYAAIEMKKQRSGVIINLSSTRALMSEANTESYSASKGGVLALTHSMAVSLGEYGIRVNSISPGWIETIEWQKKGNKGVAQHSQEDKEQHPVGRVGHPLDIAKACLYLASEDSSFMTGQNLVIDGGMTIKMIYE